MIAERGVSVQVKKRFLIAKHVLEHFDVLWVILSHRISSPFKRFVLQCGPFAPGGLLQPASVILFHAFLADIG